MDSITLTFSVEETDMLHSLLVIRRHAFVQYCHEQFHHSPALSAYIQELKVLEAKLMQISVDEYLTLEDSDNTEEPSYEN